MYQKDSVSDEGPKNIPAMHRNLIVVIGGIVETSLKDIYLNKSKPQY